MTSVRVEPKSCDQGPHKNDIFTLLAMLPTNMRSIVFVVIQQETVYLKLTLI